MPAAKAARPMSPAKAEECAAFLRHLRRTGNAAESARAVGCNAVTLWHRRRNHPDFAARWDAALVFARARLAKTGVVPPEGRDIRTAGGEHCVRRNKHGHLQVSRAVADRLSAAGVRAFLAALASTANFRLAAEATGITAAALHRRRARSDVFDAQVRQALLIGYEQVEFALLAAAQQSLDADGGDPGAYDAEIGAGVQFTQRMTPADAIMLLAMHRRTVKEGVKPFDRRMHVATREETNAALYKALDRVERRKEGK